MEKEKFNFVLDLTKKQLEFVQGSIDKDANQIALGLFANDSFVDVLAKIGGTDFGFYTKQGWATDEKSSLIFDMNRIIGMIEKSINESTK